MGNSPLLSYLEHIGLPTTEPVGKMKLAERIARLIEERIVIEAWPVGFALGREAELAAAANVSRWSFREAVVLLEQIGLVESRRGRNGGLFVSSTLFDAARNGLSNYLEFLGSTADDIREVRRALEGIVIRQAKSRMDTDTRSQFQVLLKKSENPGPAAFLAVAEIRKALLVLTGNTALSLFVHSIGQMLIHASWYSSLDDASFHKLINAMTLATRNIATALLHGDQDQAFTWEDDFLQHFGEVFSNSAVTSGVSSSAGALERADRLFPSARPTKKAEQIARQLRQQIFNADWPIGMNLGSEAELMERFTVGRATVREAIRALERLGVVQMGRGGASGLRIIRPDPAQTIIASQRYLRRSGLTASDVKCVLEALRSTDNNLSGKHANPLSATFTAILAEL